LSLLLGDEVIDVDVKDIKNDNIHLFAVQTENIRGAEVGMIVEPVSHLRPYMSFRTA
jgi:hypothetical protein